MFVHKMTGQSLKLGKFMTDQAANTFGRVLWPSVISAPQAVNKDIKKQNKFFSRGINIVRLFDALPNFPFTTSEYEVYTSCLMSCRTT